MSNKQKNSEVSHRLIQILHYLGLGQEAPVPVSNFWYRQLGQLNKYNMVSEN